MWRLSILKSKGVWSILALTMLAGILCFFRTTKSQGLPPTIVVRGGLSKSDAEALYRSHNTTLRVLYWRRVRANIRAGQFSELWLNLTRGPERIHTLSRERDGWFVVNATNRLGNSCTIRSRQPSALPLDTAWKVQSSLVERGVILKEVVLKDLAQDGAANRR